MKVFSYWSGVLTWMEQLSIASIMSTGHDLTIYSYEPNALRGAVPCKVADARELLDNRDLDELRITRPAFFSDLLRLEGIAQGAGTWLDLDLVMIKPLPSRASYLFGWETSALVCNAVLRFPTTCPVFQAYLAMCRDDPTSNDKPWQPWWRRLNTRKRNWVRKLRGKQPTAPKYGPWALTHFVTGNPATRNLIQPAHIFYPVPAARTHAIGQRGLIEKSIKYDTVCVHLWRGQYRAIHGMAAPRSGWIRDQMDGLGVSERQLAPT